MNERRNRQLSAIVGAFLVFIAGGVVLLVENLLKTPLLLSQVTLLGLAGIFDIVAATDMQLTARWAWYQWSGLGNISLGLSLPLGFVGSKNSLFFILVAGIGGLSLAAMGIDMLVYHGKCTRGERLDRNGT